MSEIKLQPTLEAIPRLLEIQGAEKVVSERLGNLSAGKARVAKTLLSCQRGLRIALLATLLASAGCGNVDLSKIDLKKPLGQAFGKETPIAASATPQPRPILERSTPAVPPTPTPEAEYKTYSVGLLTFSLGEDGIPISYKTLDGKIVKLDRNKLLEVRKKALANKEPEVFDIIPEQEVKKVSSPSNSKEHPVKKDLPEDVLSTDELAKRGIEIMQADNTDLYIRKGAFEKGEALADYASGKYRMKIVLLNAPVVSDVYMSDPKYKEIKDAYLGKGSLLGERSETRVDIEKYRKEQIKWLEQNLEDMRKKYKGENEINNSRKAYSDIISAIKIRLFEYQNKSYEELFVEAANEKEAAGIQTTMRLQDGQFGILIIAAVGEGKQYPRTVHIFVDEKGQFQFSMGLGGGVAGFEPKAEYSHPDPSWFMRNPSASKDNPKSYPYEGQATGQILRHEIKHDQLKYGPGRNVKTEDFKRPDGTINSLALFEATRGNWSEYDTDEQTMEDIKSAWQRWKDSGYKDDSGYHFVFRLKSGGYILTKKPETSNSAL